MSFLKWNLKNLYLMPVVAILLGIIGAFQASKLKVNMDLTGLLPDKSMPVIEMNRVAKEVGGAGYLLILIGPVQSPESYLSDIHHSLKNSPLVKYSYYERETYALKDKALYLISKDEFKELTDHAQNIFLNTESEASSMFDFFLTKQDIERLNQLAKPKQEIEVAEAKKFFELLKNKVPSEQYFLSKDKMYSMLLVKPTFDSTDLKLSEELIEDVRQRLNKVINDKNVEYQLLGRYAEKLQDKKQFDLDIAKTSLLSTIGLAIVLFLGLGSVRAGWFTLIGVFIAMGQTIGLAYLFVGRINILTGFLLAILSGLGSEYGIHLVRRYMSERNSGKTKEKAIEETYLIMGRSLFSAAITSASAFFILLLSDFRGFSELGVIAGLGIASIYFTFMCIFPLGAKYLPAKNEKQIQIKVSKIFNGFPFKIKHLTLYLLLIPIVVYGLNKAYFEFDFERLQNFSKKTQEMNRLTDELYGRAITPSAIMTRNSEQLQQLEAWLNKDENKKVVDQVVSYQTVAPLDMKERFLKLERLKPYFYKIPKNQVEEKTGLSFEQIKYWLEVPLYGEESIPRSLLDNFGPDKNILLVFPKERQGTYENISRYAQTLLKARELFPGMEVGSDTFVFSSILNHIIEDGKIVLILFLLGAFVVFWLDFKSIKHALILESQLVLGSLLLVVFMGLVGEPFTILNVAIIPAVLAAGIDMGVHQIHTEIESSQKEAENVKKRGLSLTAAKKIAGPIHLGMLTSICGFGSLLFAQAKMLQGIGWISLLGQLSMYLVCMILFPTIKDFLRPKLKT